MKTLSIIALIVIFTTGFLSIEKSFATESSILFAKSDWGEGFSTRECIERSQLIATYFEPNLDLAKFKAENHPTFKTLVENKSYTLSSGIGYTIRFSNQCNSDIPAFELQYMVDKTESSHTRIYVDMDYVSYDVLEISSRFVEGNYPDPIQPQPLPFYIKNWKEIQIPGEYTNSNPLIASKIFKIPYVVTGGQVKNIEGNMESIKVDLTSKGEGKFALKIPRNYPYTDHNDKDHPGHGLEVFAISDPRSEIYTHVTKSDCFYDVWIPFSGDSKIELPFRISYLQGGAFHGDSDVPKYCQAYTIADESLDQISKLSAHKQLEAGISPYDVFCKDDMRLVVKNEMPACVSDKTAARLWEIGWVDRSVAIYTYSNEVSNNFQSKLISEDDAIKIVQNYLDKTHLKLDDDKINDEKVQITTDLVYALLSKGYLSLLDIDTSTGLPTDIMPPWWERYYRSPQWYTELQKDYLGMEHERVEEGDVFWSVAYRTCLNCVADYPIFFVDPIEGKVIKTMNLDVMFTVVS